VTFCPVGAVQDTASDVDVGVALMFVTGPGSVRSSARHSLNEIIIKLCTICGGSV